MPNATYLEVPLIDGSGYLYLMQREALSDHFGYMPQVRDGHVWFVTTETKILSGGQSGPIAAFHSLWATLVGVTNQGIDVEDIDFCAFFGHLQTYGLTLSVIANPWDPLQLTLVAKLLHSSNATQRIATERALDQSNFARQVERDLAHVPTSESVGR